MSKRNPNKPCIFLDSNMIFSNPEEIDERIKELHRGCNEYWITDIIKKEIDALQKNGKTKIFNEKLNFISFSILREKYPSICPVYYNFISRMYNPANIASPEFQIHLIQSFKLREKPLPRKAEQNYMFLMNRLKKDSENEFDYLHEKKTELRQNMDISIFQYFQKKIKNRKSKNLLNDYKNISLIILFIILKKRNVIFITSDRDLIAIVLILCESIAQDLTFNYLILKNLPTEEKQLLLRNRKIKKNLDFTEFKKQYSGVLGDLISRNWQKNYKYLKIRLWDNNKKHFIEDLIIKFDPITRESLIKLHGPLSCPYGQNNDYGNWIHYTFSPPIIKPESSLVETILSIKNISRKETYVSDELHKKTCKYAIDDSNDRLNEYYGFNLG